MPGGSVSITLGGQSYEMKPAYEAAREIEGKLDITIMELTELLLAERLKIEEVAVIVFWGCQLAGAQFSDYHAVGKAVFELRLSNPELRMSIAKYLSELQFAPERAKKKFEEFREIIEAQNETG
jgi:hypothetical protein